MTPKRVFTFSRETLSSASLGTSLVLGVANVVGVSGHDLMVEAKDKVAYPVHPGYVIGVSEEGAVNVGDPVISEWAGAMKHGVVASLAKKRQMVRFTDKGGGFADTAAGPAKPVPRGAVLMRQLDGLRPGNYAAYRDGTAWKHVLLVSSRGSGDAARWFGLGFAGAAVDIEERFLSPIAVNLKANPGDAVWAEWVGTMRPGKVQAVDSPGFFSVRFERAGRPVTLGLGFVTTKALRD